jgi:hypothetical protein
MKGKKKIEEGLVTKVKPRRGEALQNTGVTCRSPPHKTIGPS